MKFGVQIVLLDRFCHKWTSIHGLGSVVVAMPPLWSDIQIFSMRKCSSEITAGFQNDQTAQLEDATQRLPRQETIIR